VSATTVIQTVLPPEPFGDRGAPPWRPFEGHGRDDAGERLVIIPHRHDDLRRIVMAGDRFSDRPHAVAPPPSAAGSIAW
jgi:hypothetical protein